MGYTWGHHTKKLFQQQGRETPLYQLKINPEKNRLYITLGAAGTGEGRQLFEEVKTAILSLQTGFTVVSDIRNFSVIDPKEGAWADKIIKFLAESGMQKAVRVTGVKASTEKRTEKYGYTVLTADTIQAAEHLLDE